MEASDGAQQRGDGIAEGDGPKGCPRQRAQRPPYRQDNGHNSTENALKQIRIHHRDTKVLKPEVRNQKSDANPLPLISDALKFALRASVSLW